MDDKILKIFKDEELGNLEELQEVARKADILSKRFAIGKPKISKEKKFVYDRAQKIYSKFWSEQMAETIGKKSLANFSGTSPVSMLSDGLQSVVMNGVGNLIEQGAIGDVLETTVLLNEDAFNEIAIEYSEEYGIEIDNFTDEDLEKIIDIFADRFLADRLNTLQQVYKLPEIFNMQKELSADEDFNGNVAVNYDKMDHDKKINHTRTKFGVAVSLDEIYERADDSEYGLGLYEEINQVENPESEVEKIFLSVLDDEEKKIYFLLKQGRTQQEIAEALGYKTHSAVSKKKKVMLEKIKVEIDRQNNI